MSQMLDANVRTQEAGLELLGELHQLGEQLGRPQELISWQKPPGPIEFCAPKNLKSLRVFLETYRSQILIAHELPAILAAFYHSSRYEVRELIALDCRLGQEAKLQRFAIASQFLGTTQLQKLRPLHDQRLVRRYWDAVENGEAHGWHIVVYGIILSLYSLPLRQGLLNYGEQVMRGFVNTAKLASSPTDEQRRKLCSSLCSPLRRAVEVLLNHQCGVFGSFVSR